MGHLAFTLTQQLTLMDSSSSSVNFAFCALSHNSLTRGSRNSPRTFSPVAFSFSFVKLSLREAWVSWSLSRNFLSSSSLKFAFEKTEFSEISSWSTKILRRRLYSFSLSLWWLNSVWRSPSSSELNLPKVINVKITLIKKHLGRKNLITHWIQWL